MSGSEACDSISVTVVHKSVRSSLAPLHMYSEVCVSVCALEAFTRRMHEELTTSKLLKLAASQIHRQNRGEEKKL